MHAGVPGGAEAYGHGPAGKKPPARSQDRAGGFAYALGKLFLLYLDGHEPVSYTHLRAHET